MNPAKYVEKLMADFDALPNADEMASFDELPSPQLTVELTEYLSEDEWAKAPEPFCTFAESKEINRLLAAELRSRGIIVKFRKLGGLELSFKVTHFPEPGIGWAVFKKGRP